VNQMCSISLPCLPFVPGGHEPSGRGARPRCLPRAQTQCVCQRVIGPPGEGPCIPRRSANMTPINTSERPRCICIDERLDVLRVHVAIVLEKVVVLRVEPVHRAVNCKPGGQGHPEPRRRRGLRVSPLTGGASRGFEQAHGGGTLLDRRQGERRVLLETVDAATAAAVCPCFNRTPESLAREGRARS